MEFVEPECKLIKTILICIISYNIGLEEKLCGFLV